MRFPGKIPETTTVNVWCVSLYHFILYEQLHLVTVLLSWMWPSSRGRVSQSSATSVLSWFHHKGEPECRSQKQPDTLFPFVPISSFDIDLLWGPVEPEDHHAISCISTYHHSEVLWLIFCTSETQEDLFESLRYLWLTNFSLLSVLLLGNMGGTAFDASHQRKWTALSRHESIRQMHKQKVLCKHGCHMNVFGPKVTWLIKRDVSEFWGREGDGLKRGGGITLRVSGWWGRRKGSTWKELWRY